VDDNVQMSDFPNVSAAMGERYLEMIKRYQSLKHEIARIRQRETQQIIRCIVEMMVVYEIDPHDVEVALSKRQRGGGRSKAIPRYMDPVTGRTWAGRGRRPLWMGGRDPADFLLPETD